MKFFFTIDIQHSPHQIIFTQMYAVHDQLHSLAPCSPQILWSVQHSSFYHQ